MPEDSEDPLALEDNDEDPLELEDNAEGNAPPVHDEDLLSPPRNWPAAFASNAKLKSFITNAGAKRVRLSERPEEEPRLLTKLPERVKTHKRLEPVSAT